MSRAFADTAYFLALLNPRDLLHGRARDITPSLRGGLITTAWVITELVDAFCRPPGRARVMVFVRDSYADPRVTVVPPTQELFDAGLDFVEQRQDKEWSLTAGRHFAQAGFNILLK